MSGDNQGRRYVLAIVALIVGLIIGAGIMYLVQPTPEVVGPTTVTKTETRGTTMTATVTAPVTEKKPFEGIRIVSLCGASGDPFADRLFKGSEDAEKLLGCTVDSVFCGWDPEGIVKAFADAIAINPDGIVVIGHAGWDAMQDNFEEAFERGIPVSIRNVDVPQARERWQTLGCGYVGADLYLWGWNTGKEMVRRFNIQPGETAAVLCGVWGQPVRSDLDFGVVDAMEDSGVIVDKIVADVEIYSVVEATIPFIAGYHAANPETKYYFLDSKGAVQMFMEAIGKGPGEIKTGCFNVDPMVLDSIESGYLQFTSDQQPYLQGYLPIVNLCNTIKYGHAGLFIETTGSFVDESNIDFIYPLAEEGYR